MTDWLGHLHPVLLHYPFGMLAAVVVMEVVAWRRGEAPPPALRGWLYGLTAFSGFAAGGTGWVLGHSGEETPLIERHEQWGIALCLALIALALLAWRRPAAGRARAGLLGLCVVVAVGAGHLGGTLTHGRGFVGEGAPGWFAGPTAALDSVLLPEVEVPPKAGTPGGGLAIFPILQRSCVECHGPDKQKGKLRLDTLDGLESTLDRAFPLESELIYRIGLPRTHEDVMPPEEEEALPPEEVTALVGWVLAGAPMDSVEEEQASAAQLLMAEGELLAYLQERTGARIGPATGFDPVYAAEEREAFVAAAGGAPLAVDFSLGRGALDAETLRALAPLRERVAELSLAGRSLQFDGALLPEFPHCARLHVERSGATPADLRALIAAVPKADYLNLHGTGADDALLAELLGHPTLRRLVLHDTAVTSDAVAAYRAARPEVQLTADLSLPPVADRARRILIADAGKQRLILLRERAIGDYEVLWEQPHSGVHGLRRTQDGKLLLLEAEDRAVELDPATGERGKAVATPAPAADVRAKLGLRTEDLPGMELGEIVLVEELPGGTFLVGQRGAGPAEPQLFEVNRAKEVLWTFRDHERFSDQLITATVWEGPLGGD